MDWLKQMELSVSGVLVEVYSITLVFNQQISSADALTQQVKLDVDWENHWNQLVKCWWHNKHQNTGASRGTGSDRNLIKT